MTDRAARPGGLRTAGRVLWHYVELVIAVNLGMLLLGMAVGALLPAGTRADVGMMIMVAEMAVVPALWMAVRRHRKRAIGEMAAVIFAPFVILSVLFWLEVLGLAQVSMIGHWAMYVLMAASVLRRRGEYAALPRLAIRGKWVKGAAVVLIVLLVPGAVSAASTIGRFGSIYEARADAVSAAPAARSHDPAKPTVALLTGGNGTNAADLLGPYEVLASTGRFNLYVVSAGPRLIPMTGGLDIVPDVTFDELDRLMSGQGDTLDAVIFPAMQTPEPAELSSINAWARRQAAAGALTVSVCNGARALARTGLLDGRPATSHWLRMRGLRADFPTVKWRSGMRYVDDGDVITAAGVLSGIDAALRIVERLADVPTARQAAGAVHWRHYSPGAPASIPVRSLEPADLVAPLNSSYQTGPSDIGVLLTDGVGELELASVFNSYTEQAVVGRTIAAGDGPIRSAHGLTFVPRTTLAAAAGGLDRLLVPGLDAARRQVPGIGDLRPEYVHTTEEFAFDAVLRDIARTYDVATARFAAKTLEYPIVDVKLAGAGWPWFPTLVFFLFLLLGVAAAWAITVAARSLNRRRAHA
ncbi:DJ-1/PfpI family protein [Nonomuraea sp. NPDC049309]|uniref:DJ-1/PfpI family protein n=1 Tax=Nonomuraea sp. NPDC049309 TaxID=3364350 RepID=UPI0037146FBD